MKISVENTFVFTGSKKNVFAEGTGLLICLIGFLESESNEIGRIFVLEHAVIVHINPMKAERNQRERTRLSLWSFEWHKISVLKPKIICRYWVKSWMQISECDLGDYLGRLLYKYDVNHTIMMWIVINLCLVKIESGGPRPLIC